MAGRQTGRSLGGLTRSFVTIPGPAKIVQNSRTVCFLGRRKPLVCANCEGFAFFS